MLTARFSAVTDSRDISQLSAKDFAQRISERSILVQPLGAVEQHGPHLPLATDSIIAEAVAREGVLRAVAEGVDAWFLPTLSFSKSNEHAWCPGTIWLSAATMQAVVSDIGRSVAMSRCRKLVFLNGHGGNSSLVSMMNRELRLQHGLMTFLAHPALPADQGGGSHKGEAGMGIHGGHDETSLMLHLRPGLVDMTHAKRSIPEALRENTYVRFGGSVQFGWLSNDFDEGGVIGDPEGANAEHGAAAFANAIRAFCGALHEIDAYNVRGG
jgi:creatinine amidohydrolase